MLVARRVIFEGFFFFAKEGEQNRINRFFEGNVDFYGRLDFQNICHKISEILWVFVAVSYLKKST